MKKSWIRGVTKVFLVSINLIIVSLYLLGCLIPWLNEKHFWVVGFIGLIMPYLLLLLIGSIIFWFFVKKKFAFFLFIILCFGYKQITVMFAFNTSHTFSKKKSNYNLRVVSWNIGNMSGRPLHSKIKMHSIDEIVSSVLKQNADVVCLQEFEECKNGCKSFELLKKAYPYYYFPGWIIGPHRHKTGNVILSKYPIINADSTRFENGENIIASDIVYGLDTISFFTTHLDSYKFSREEFKEIDAVGVDEKIPKRNFIGIIRKMKNTFKVHNKESDVVKLYMSKRNFPVVFCGDLNEVATNNSYWKIRGNKQDAFLVKGLGFGKTFNSLSTSLRIDYIFPDNNFNVTQFNIVDEQLSDHKMLVTDLILKKYQSK